MRTVMNKKVHKRILTEFVIRLTMALVVGITIAISYIAFAQPTKSSTPESVSFDAVKYFRDNSWDPGFGPHAQEPPPPLEIGRIRRVLDCPVPHLVCCDSCGLCVCEPFVKKCPEIMLMDRRYCNPEQ
jgi:hypothetical protein